ncbi:MAG TPA: GntR family transcriptional regulator [Jatrophihabitans sp.]|jgi:DNA-binding GntR family transcriptional regulator
MTVSATAVAPPAAEEVRPAISAADSAREEIERRIIQLELVPGATFTEGDLASSLGMSKTPVREALTLLAIDGLVAVAPRIGYRVTPVTMRDVQDLFDLRTLLEAEAFASAASRRPAKADLPTLDRSARGSVADFLAADTQFHIQLGRGSGNAMLSQLIVRAALHHERLMRLAIQLSPQPEAMKHDHDDLVAALHAGDQASVRSIATSELARTRQLVFEAMVASESILDARIVYSEPLRLTFANDRRSAQST